MEIIPCGTINLPPHFTIGEPRKGPSGIPDCILLTAAITADAFRLATYVSDCHIMVETAPHLWRVVSGVYERPNEVVDYSLTLATH